MRKTLLTTLFLLCLFGMARAWTNVGLRTAESNSLTVFPTAASSNNHVPAYVFYWDDFTKSQCVIPASELTSMAGGTITSMKFYTTSYNVPYTSVSTVDFYLKEVESETLGAYVSKADATVVYSGTIDIVSVDGAGEVTITFTTPFTYNGGNLLIGSENTTDAGYKSIYFIGEEGHTGAAIAGSNGSSLDEVSLNNYDFLPKTTFTYTEGGGGGGGSTVYDFEDGQIPDAFTNTSTYPWIASADVEAGFNGTYCAVTTNVGVASSSSVLELTADYPEDGIITFKALCKGEGTSSVWDKCEFYIDDAVQFTYGASVTGWNDYIYDVAAGSHTFKWSYTKDSSVNPTGDYMAIDDVTINIGGSSTVATPTNVTVSEITENSAKVSWDGTGDSFAYRYRPVNAPAPGEGDWYYYDDGVNEDAIGTGSGSNFYWGIMIPAGSYDGTQLTKVSAYDYKAMTGTVTIYNDGTTAPEDAVASAPVTFTGAGDFVEFDVEGATIDPTKNVWIVFYNESGTDYPAAVCNNTGDANGRWVSLDGVDWADLTGYGLDYTFMIRAYIETPVTAPEMAPKAPAAWQEGTTTDNFVTLSGLTAETQYEVQVQAVAYGISSEWTPTVSFTTLAAVPVVAVPTDLAISDITTNSAVATWTGTNDSYTLRYRPVPSDPGAGVNSFSVDFESGMPDGWTVIDANNDGYTWCLTSDIPTTWTYYASLTVDWYHNGTNAICSGSYINGVGALTPDDYLVSPQVSIVNGSTFSFYAAATDGSYPSDHFGVFVSDNGTSDWTMVQEWTLTAAPGYEPGPKGADRVPKAPQRVGTWYQYSVDLTAYAGQKYIAIRHFNCNDQYIMCVDDIELSTASKAPFRAERKHVISMLRGAAEWTTVDVTETTAELTGLDPETTYEVQVQGITGGDASEWTDVVTFTTLAAPAVPAPTDLAISDITATSAVATWTGSNDTYTLRYRPVEDPVSGDGDTFSVDFENSAMPEGWTTIDNGTPSGYGWQIGSEKLGSTGNGHNESLDFILSQSYDNNYGVVYPDNYLISPKVNIGAGSTFSFWACGQDASYAAEHLGVAVSTTGTNASDFTMVQEWTMTAAPGMKKGPGKNGAPNRAQGTWYQYTVDLSDYAGQQVYIAIRHFDCSDMFYLDVDDIELSNGATAPQMAKRKHVISMLRGEAEWTTLDVAETTAELTGLEPETTYEVQVQGVTGGEVSDWTDVVTFTTLAAPAVEVPTDLAISEITSESAVATWSGTTDTYNIRYREVTASTDEVTVTLTTDDIWGDGSGYQMLLDADATAYGTLIPESGPMTTGGDVDASVYAEFEYKIPEEADGSLTTTNMVCGASASIQIPAGTYDYVITNPTPGDRMWIASAQGNAGGRQDDYTFEAGKVYEFHVYESGSYDATDVTITDARGAAEWTTVEGVTSPYSLTGLTAETEYEVQVQGVTGGVASDWSASVLFTTTEATGINGLKVAGQEKWYTIDGRKLAKRPTTAGVYILNGSKVIIK